MANARMPSRAKPDEISAANTRYSIIQMPVFAAAELLVMVLPLKGGALSWINAYTVCAPLLVFMAMLVFAVMGMRRVMLILGIAGMMMGLYLLAQGFLLLCALDNDAIAASDAFWAVIRGADNYFVYCLPVMACALLVMIISAYYTGVSGKNLKWSRSPRQIDAQDNERDSRYDESSGAPSRGGLSVWPEL